ncbi:MAG: cytochrome P450 [Clostridiales bacterium]|nr:cytochrome P450 [Clostridiales bacterium]
MRGGIPIFCLRNLESSPMLLLDGYEFISKRCNRYGTDLFETRFMGQKVICMRGEEAARLFYDEDRFRRKGAAPKRIQKTLFGENGVQGLDAAEHKLRKMMFLSIMVPENVERLRRLTRKQWEIHAAKWEGMDTLVLFDEVQKLMCQVACKWAGVPLRRREIELRASDLGKMVDALGAIGPRYWQGRCARHRSEEWMRNMIDHIRSYSYHPRIGSAAHTIAWHYNTSGKLLSTQVAAVELLNIIRPIVAITTYIIFGALAMHQHPECRIMLKEKEKGYTDQFVQEVRRFFPFTPFIGARVKKGFLWKNHFFEKGTLVMLDVYGMNHDPRIWENPNQFNPKRFEHWKENPYVFIPQGGGDPKYGHRCAGESVTCEVMAESLLFLANRLEYRVPKQNLDYSLRRMPTLPKSRFIIQDIKLIS